MLRVFASRLWHTVVARLWPDGIAARTAWMMVMALVLTQAISALVYLTDRGEGGPGHNPWVLIRRVAAIVQLVESTAPADRPRVVSALDDPVLGVDWRRTAPSSLEDRTGFPFDVMRKRLRYALRDPGRLILIEARPSARLPVPLPVGAADDDRRRHFQVGTLTLALPLMDGTWLVFTASDEAGGPFRLLRFGLWMGLIGLVIAMLSLLATRRLTTPLTRFAEAAERLGVDGEAPPLPEAGPRELRVATRAFNRMQERLSRFVDDRTQMLAAISHDLRTPLTRLRLRAEFIEDPEQQRKMLADLDEMAAMIASTLAFARDDAKREPRAVIDLADLLQSLCDDRVDAGQSAAYEGPARLTFGCRPVALRRALANLIDNAIHYGGGARIRLAEGIGPVTIAVDDDGPGIPETELEKVFTPFYRLERSRSRESGGVGLGLSVARTIARGHGGDVTLSNRPEGGLRATMVLPT